VVVAPAEMELTPVGRFDLSWEMIKSALEELEPSEVKMTV